MSNFAAVSAQVPARYRDARSGLRFRVIDVTEDEAPDVVVTTEIGDGLLGALFWERIGVTSDTMKTWGVSPDEAMATATANIEALPVNTETRKVSGADVDITSGDAWASSLIVAESRKADTEDGFLVAIPHASVMITTQVVGAETVEGLEFLMNMCDELYGIDEWSGISPHVWWWFDDNYWRVTDRTEDGSIDFRFHTNVNAYHLAGAIEHLANPCDECGRE